MAPSTELVATTRLAVTPADDPNGKLDITKCASYWLKDYQERGIQHICWDGCMFPNDTLEKEETWNTILKAMVDVRENV